mmetsp:Transcript_8316/g.24603  ORF Transcript_8316/g.24603 Transcript_8316/m.24603 type:complete len:204 (+) Transcript_8316:471-1082(+)
MRAMHVSVSTHPPNPCHQPSPGTSQSYWLGANPSPACAVGQASFQPHPETHCLQRHRRKHPVRSGPLTTSRESESVSFFRFWTGWREIARRIRHAPAYPQTMIPGHNSNSNSNTERRFSGSRNRIPLEVRSSEKPRAAPRSIGKTRPGKLGCWVAAPAMAPAALRALSPAAIEYYTTRDEQFGRSVSSFFLFSFLCCARIQQN